MRRARCNLPNNAREKARAGILAASCLAKSNLPEHGDGATDLRKVGEARVVDIRTCRGHYAISSLFESYPEKTRIYCYEAGRSVFGGGGRKDTSGDG